jgi:uncharacterized membrane protein YbhN (UPF0104 family)
MLPVSVRQAVLGNTCGDAIASFTPARAGGEPIRFLALRRSGVPAPQIFAAFAMEVLVDATLIVIITAVFCAAFAEARFAILSSLTRTIASPAFPWIVAAMLLVALAGRWLFRFRHVLPAALRTSIRDAKRELTILPLPRVAGVVGTTLLSMAARTAILPVLAVVPGVDLPTMLLASFGLIYSQSILPTPSGAGGVELFFIALFGGRLNAAAMASLLLVWRFYTVGIPGIVGGALLIRLGWWRGGKRYTPETTS